jgi:hypothetical protein
LSHLQIAYLVWEGTLIPQQAKCPQDEDQILVQDNVPQISFPFFFAVLGFELRAYTLSHSTSPIFVTGFLR